MPSISFSGQSFAIDNRRLWLVVAGMEYARIAPDQWAARLSDVRDAGFNTVITGCPWFLHEPRRGHMVFDAALDVRHFVELAGQTGLRVILRVGPHIGSGFDGGGIPSWITRESGAVVRTSSEAFMGRVSRYLQALLGTVAHLQVTREGPILAVQTEDAWACGNDAAAEPYLRELSRIVRESGMSVPLLNANNLWIDRGHTLDTWQGQSDLLANLRQLRTLQPDAPRIAAIPAADHAIFGGGDGGGGSSSPKSPEDLMLAIGQVLAAGAQPIVTPFHAGTFFGFQGGRIDGAADTVTTAAAANPPLGEAGARSAAFARIRRIATFASRFSALFADLDPSYQPVVADPESSSAGNGRKGAAPARTIVPLRGRGGQVIFVFGSGKPMDLLLEDGTHLPVDSGDQTVAWYLVDADLQGRGRLDYANLCAFALIDQRLLVLYGPANAPAILSLNGTPISATVPAGKTPTIIDQKGIRVVICNEAQIDAATALPSALVIGASGLPDDARSAPVSGWNQTLIIRAEGDMETVRHGGAPRRTRKAIKLQEWLCCPATEYATGAADRYASLAGPQSLPDCGSPQGYGWYRLSMRVGAAKKRRVLAPFAGPRVRWYLDGAHAATTGSGLDATAEPFDLDFKRGERHLCALVDNAGRRGTNDAAGEVIGISGTVYEVKQLAVKPKLAGAVPVNPFAAAPFIIGVPAGAMSSEQQYVWSLTHAKKSPLIVQEVDLPVSGTLVVNDQPVARLGDHAGAPSFVVLDPATLACFSGNKHVLRFAPDVDTDLDVRRIAACIRLFETTADVAQTGSWSFAKWEAPPSTRFRAAAGDHAPVAGLPAWWRCRFECTDTDRPLWLDTAGLGKGFVMLNGEPLARYFTGGADGKAVGPQTNLLLPASMLHTARVNELVIFDEFGRSPESVRIIERELGDLDAQ